MSEIQSSTSDQVLERQVCHLRGGGQCAEATVDGGEQLAEALLVQLSRLVDALQRAVPHRAPPHDLAYHVIPAARAPVLAAEAPHVNTACKVDSSMHKRCCTSHMP